LSSSASGACLARDVLLGFALIPVSLVFLLGGICEASWLLYGTPPPSLPGHPPLPAALYGVLVFPFVWGLTEQMTYNGYLVPRLQVLCRSTSVAIAALTGAASAGEGVRGPERSRWLPLKATRRSAAARSVGGYLSS